MRVPVLAASLAFTTLGPGARAGHAESATGQTVEGIKELTAPATSAEIRCDVGLVASLGKADGRLGVDVEIAPRPDHWYGLGAAAIVRTTVTTTVKADGSVITTAETAESIGLSARFFKRIGPLVLSAGLVDSAGGAGLEVRVLDDRLRLEVLAANWHPSDATATPRLRVGGSAQWRFLYVQAGALDVLDDARASAFIGGGVRWRDPDLLATLFWIGR